MNKTERTDSFQETVYREYRERVSRYIHSRVTNPSDAEDLLSCVFLKVYQGLGGFCEEKASLSTWIYTITRNTVQDFYRRKTPVLLPENWREISENDTAEDLLLAQEQLEELAEALEQLEQRQRDLIILHYYKEKTLRDIAVQMGMSYSNAKVLHTKALSRLKELLNI